MSKTVFDNEFILKYNNKFNKKPLFKPKNIDIFRYDSLKFYNSNEIYKTFLSSGTTNTDKSKSFFSKKGFEIYKYISVLTFKHALLKRYNIEVCKYDGYSLIPSVKTWNNSSLAYMIGFLKDNLNLKYIKYENIFEISKSKKPFWIFATMIHWLQVIENTKQMKLPKNTILIHTGGNKGVDREISVYNLEEKLKKHFNIYSSQIISEYSMSELSSQAYTIENNIFQFPKWVKLNVSIKKNNIQNQGKGALIIYDPMRIDYPFAMITSDIVELEKNGCFKFLNRSVNAYPKGCSLNVKEIGYNLNIEKCEFREHKLDIINIYKNINIVNNVIFNLLENENYIKLLENEFSNNHFCKFLIEDIKKSIPKNKEKWIKSILNALGIKKLTDKIYYKKWLIILPNNHSIVCLYPVILGSVIGLNIYLKLPSRNEKVNNTISFIIDYLIKNLSDLKIYKFNDKKIKIDAINLYAKDNTIDFIKKKYKIHTNGFGSGFSLSVLYSCEFFENIKLIINDAFTLDQNGCMNSKLILIIKNQNINKKLMTEKLIECARLKNLNFNSYFDMIRKYQIMGFSFFNKNQIPLIPIAEIKSVEIGQNIIPNKNDILPVLILDDLNDLNLILDNLNQIKFVLYSNKLSTDIKKIKKNGIFFKKIGESNFYNWDGYYENKALFK